MSDQGASNPLCATHRGMFDGTGVPAVRQHAAPAQENRRATDTDN